MKLKEEYKEFPYPQYKDTYKVSNLGKIINSKSNNTLKTHILKGYVCIRINNDTFRIDNLVAKCFIGESNLFLTHIDNNNKNNMSCNLEYKSIPKHLKNIYGNEWKMVKNYKDYYVSNKGDIWSLFSEKILTTHDSYGYKRVNIGGKKNSKKRYVHTLVAEAFLDNPNNYKVVNHKNGIKTDCNVSNLEWTTHSENNLHSIYNLGNNNFNSHIKEKHLEPLNSIELIWLPNYLITKDGRVYSKKNKKFLKLYLRSDGYISINANNKGYKVHRLVASAFLPTPSKEKIYVNHKNLNRSDNNVENLEWISPSENTKHEINNNPNRYSKQEVKVACLDKNTEEVITIYESLAKAAKDKNIKCSGNISNVCRGIAKTTGGYKWKYV
jgi:hypothetical protein